jgi:hypothetical protein
MFFKSEEECKEHEKTCSPAYALRVSISVNMNDSFDTVEKIDGDVYASLDHHPEEHLKDNDIRFSKLLDNEYEDVNTIEYTANKLVRLSADVRTELFDMRDKLLEKINTDIDKIKEKLNSQETSDKLDQDIEKALKRLQNT